MIEADIAELAPFKEQLVAEMDQRLRIIGAVNSWTMPIKNRTDMLSTGIRTTLGVKIFGPDLEVIQRIGHDIEGALSSLYGTASIYATGRVQKPQLLIFHSMTRSNKTLVHHQLGSGGTT